MKIQCLIATGSVALLAGLGLGFSPGLPAAAADIGPIGMWKTADGTANVAIRPCGSDLCGYVSWARSSSSIVGREVLVNMKPGDGVWSGIVVDATNGRKYTARISLRSEKTLKVEGCVMGGIICGDQQWSRIQ